MDEAQVQAILEQLRQFVEDGPASEATLGRIAQRIGAIPADTRSRNDLRRTMDETAGGLEDLEGSFNSLDREVSRSKDAFNKVSNDLRGTGSSMIRSVGQIAQGSAEGVNQIAQVAIKSATALASAVVGIIPFIGAGLATAVKAAGEALGAGFSFLLGAAQKTVTVFASMSDAGAQFGGSLIAMRDAATNAEVSLNTFSQGFLANSAGLTRFANGATAGAQALSNLSAAVKAGNLDRQLFALGISLQDQPKYLGEYLSGLAASGVRIDNFAGRFDELARRAVDYRKELVIARQLTGESNEEQQAALRNIQKDNQFQAKLSTMSADAAEGVTQQMRSLPEALRPLYRDLVLFGRVTKDSAGLMMAYPNAQAAMLEALSDPTSGAEGLREAMARRSEGLMQDVNNATEMVILSGMSNSTAVKQSADAFVAVRDYSRTLADGYEEIVNSTTTNLDKLGNNVAAFNERLEELQKTVENVVTNILGTDAFTGMIDIMSDAVKGLKTGIDESMKMFADPEAYLGKQAEKIGQAFEQALRSVLPDWLIRSGGSTPMSQEKVEQLQQNVQGPIDRRADRIAEAEAQLAANPNHRGLQDHLRRLRRLQEEDKKFQEMLGRQAPPAEADANAPRRAYGGAVIRNRPYMVGESGPEIFTPASSGSITTNFDIQRAAETGGAAASYNSQTLENISSQLSQHSQLLEQMIKVQRDGFAEDANYLRRISMN